ncbi:hypothetical protein GCM10008932_22130 [Alkalibacterium iburiense]|uniref:AbrB family transcriptional regulator n=1 Tax=Alkalibacterium iburiense TaxID=290589 RepID=A0ABN0XQN6_9LACT
MWGEENGHKKENKKLGNSLTISIPSEFNVEEGKEYYMTKDQNGIITLMPKIEDYFSNAKAGFYESMEWDDIYKPEGSERDI